VAVFLGVLALAVVALSLGDPSPPQAKANVACDTAGAVTGAIGIGNPVGDACASIADPVLGVAGHVLDPLKDAAAELGKGVFNQITTWATDGAVWLLSRVVELTNKTTSPDLLSKGFLRQYRQMAAIAVVLAVLMLLFACLEGLGRGDAGMLWRVFLVNVPVAALATSAAYVVVQLLIATTDGFSEAIAHSTAADTRTFFKGAVEALAEAGAGAGAVAGTAAGGAGAGTAEGAGAGAVAVPLSVGFIAAIVVAFAAFLVWIELLMRDAAIYTVALFMPMAIAASIWPRWTSALRRTAELLIVVVFSKFVIVAIIALAASLLANTGGKVEHVLAAGALLMLACCAPFALFKLVPFAEGAVSSAYGRQSAGGVAVQSVQLGGSVAMMRRAAHANWSGGSQGGGAAGGQGGGGAAGGGASKGRPGGSGGGGGSASAGGASGGAAGAVALPVTAGAEAVKGTKAAAGKLASSGTAQASGDAGSGAKSSSGASASSRSGGGGERAPRPRAEESASSGQASSSSSTSSTPEPTEATGGKAPGSGAKPPRPSGDVGAASKGSAAGKTKP
jgi:hypothetical protein